MNSMPQQTDELAINGGKPVRSKLLPKAHYGAFMLGEEELALLTEVIQNRSPFRGYGIGQPHMVDDFESKVKEYIGMPYALATATGSGSFYCAMAGLGLGPGDEVIIPSFAWLTDFYAPVLLGATPVFADIDRSLNLDPKDFEKKISSNTKAVMVVHFQGAANKIDEIVEIAHRHGIKVIEDCAQAMGAVYKGKKVGSFGDISCFSLQQNKILTSGDGGFLLTKDARVYERAVMFHDLGMVRPASAAQLENNPEEKQFCGCQFRMNEFTGAVALAQLKKLDSVLLALTRKNYWTVRERLVAECPGMEFRNLQDPRGDAGITLFIDLKTPGKAKWFSEALQAENIQCGPSSSCSNLLGLDVVKNKVQVHPSLPPFGPGWPGEKMEYTKEMCPRTDDISLSMVAISISPEFSEQDMDDIVMAVSKVWNN
jgi:8-amino-3,8-dideoxy-alpha-D-manno-octulosonate transaminase